MSTELQTLPAIPHGSMDHYSIEELGLIQKANTIGQRADATVRDWEVAIVALKLKLDAEDQTNGKEGELTQAGSLRSRFWAGIERGDFGPRKHHPESDAHERTSSFRKKIYRLKEANQAAESLFPPSTCRQLSTCSPALKDAFEAGIGSSTLEIYAKSHGEARRLHDAYFKETKELKADVLKALSTVGQKYPELIEQTIKRLGSAETRKPSELKLMMHRRDIAIAEERKAREALSAAERERKAAEAAAKAATEAEAQAARREHLRPSEWMRQEGGVTCRVAPSKASYETEQGKKDLELMIGDLPKFIAPLLQDCKELIRRMESQCDISGSVHNYAMFHGAYDKFIAGNAWGVKGRRGRMEHLAKEMRHGAAMIENYLRITTPPENTQYPEE